MSLHRKMIIFQRRNSRFQRVGERLLKAYLLKGIMQMVITKNEQTLFFKTLNFLPTPALIAREDKCNHRGRVLFVNKAFVKTIGYRVTDIPDHLSFISKAYPDINYRHEMTNTWLDKITQLVNREISLLQLCSKIHCKDQKYRWFDIRTELRSTIGKGVIIVLFNNVDKAKTEALQYAKLASIDPLTKLANRRYIQQLLQQEKSHQGRDNQTESFSLVMADIDFFKQINDTYGHSCGDYVIETVARIMRQTTRKVDTVARWGGEEYLLLLPQTNTIEARIVVKKIMSRIHSYAFVWEGKRFKVTLTYGITAYHANEETDETIKRVDSCLYQGKEMGRNCIVSDGLLEAWGG
ncbi:MAG TPA: GGDEF domain-containing protein [Leucothrix mucor]|uniref:diguanylate cyclase n=1 Tax=Leucothrix mucor TaxID=45248 RepID=A0A7V2SY20_LEUMU|nr:GGDEF domain-containing protein [Leucothrix mucor]